MQTTFSSTKRPPHLRAMRYGGQTRPIVIAADVRSFSFGWWYYAQTEGAPALA